MDETYVKLKGKWGYLYQAVDKNGDTLDFMFSINLGHPWPKSTHTTGLSLVAPAVLLFNFAYWGLSASPPCRTAYEIAYPYFIS